MILAHADRMRKRVAQKYLYRSGWLVAWLAARGAGWLASASRLAGWLLRGLFTGWRPAGWRVAGWLALACVACAGVASGSLFGQSGGRERPQAGGRARDSTRGG